MAKNAKPPAKAKKKPAAKAKKKAAPKKLAIKKLVAKKPAVKRIAPAPAIAAPTDLAPGATVEVLERLWQVVLSRKNADPNTSHSARLLSRGIAKVAQKFGEEAVECIIDAVAGSRATLVGESADVLYHLMVLWVAADLHPAEVWAELHRREGISGIAEKAARKQPPELKTRKIP